MKKISVVIIACLLFVCIFACAGCGEYEKNYVNFEFYKIEGTSVIKTDVVTVKLGDAVNVPIDLRGAKFYTDITCTAPFDVTLAVTEGGGTTVRLYYTL